MIFYVCYAKEALGVEITFFFNFPFSRRLWRKIRKWSYQGRLDEDWHNLINCAATNWKR